MNKSDFKKGQIVYVSRRSYYGRKIPKEIIQGEVVSIGSKYISVQIGLWDVRKFEINNNFHECVTAGSADYELYLSEQAIRDDEEKYEIVQLIKDQYNQYSCYTDLTIDQLRRIKKIIEETTHE